MSRISVKMQVNYTIRLEMDSNMDIYSLKYETESIDEAASNTSLMQVF